MAYNVLTRMMIGLPALVIGFGPAMAAICPAIGASADCGVVITRAADGTFSIVNTGIGPYDGGDDTLVGIVNNGPDALASITLSGSDIFGFDGDGLTVYGNPSYGPTGYEGPNTSFTFTDANTGVVHFTGGLAAGASAYFGLEENITGASGTIPPVTIGSGTPEPETWALMLVGFGAIGAVMRRRVMTVTYA